MFEILCTCKNVAYNKTKKVHIYFPKEAKNAMQNGERGNKCIYIYKLIVQVYLDLFFYMHIYTLLSLIYIIS